MGRSVFSRADKTGEGKLDKKQLKKYMHQSQGVLETLAGVQVEWAGLFKELERCETKDRDLLDIKA